MEKSLKILRYIILAGVFLTPFLVLVVIGSLFFPFITGKNFSFRIITEIIFALWLVLIIFDKRYLPRNKDWRNLLLLSLLAFTLFVFLSAVFGVNFYRSFWSNYERMEGVLAYLHLFALFLVFISVINSEKLWKIFFNTSLGVSVIVGIYGLLQLAGKLAIHQGSTRLDATFGNASYLAVYAVFHIFIAALLFFKSKNWRPWRWFYVPIVILNSVVLYFTATRGAILGFVGGLIIAFFLNLFFNPSKKIKIISFSFLVGAVFIIIIFLALKNSSFIQNSPVLSRFSNISFTERTTESRLVIWKMSWQGFLERPIFGWGPENYNLVFNKYYQPVLWSQEAWFDRAHNVFLDKLTENGIFGLLSYLGLFVFSLYYLWPPRASLARGGFPKNSFALSESIIFTSLLAAYFFHNLFVFDNITSLIFFYAVLAYILSRSKIDDNEGKTERQYQKNNGAKTAYVFVISIAAIFVIYYVNIPAILAGNDLIKALSFSSQGQLEKSLAEFQSAISRNSLGTGEAREQLSSFASQVLVFQEADNSFKQKVFDVSVSEMKKQLDQSPTDIRYMIFLASIYNKAQRYDDSINILQKATEISPNKQQLYFELGTSYINKKDYAAAVGVLKKAFNLDQSFLEARKLYAVALIYSGNVNAADELMKDYGGTIVTDERFIFAFLTSKMYDRVIGILEKFIENDPNNYQYYVNEAVVYLNMGDRQTATEKLQKAIELNPDFKAQGEYYINEIKAGRNP
ncbi:MAG: O-antigen ligase WaaL [Parcubacteria group bacterium Athens0714_24]|nr:MAG: O-antigen ligase WaaL [Parcubacteria group bacterium Athens0714_24]